MLKTLKNLFKQDKEKFLVPKSVQSVIPIKTIWENGIFLVGKNKYAKTFKFEDINYAVASREDKEAMFLEYSELLNSLDSGATTKITINNRRLNKADFEQTILIPMADDGLDTNVDTHSRLICYDVLDLGKQLQPIGMLVVLDSILNRITQNRAKGRNTFIFIDEIYLLFQHEYSANFLFTLWKRVRKYGAYCTGITQNVDDLLQSHTARTMLANSEFIIMLNQASTDRIELAKLLNISDLQLSYITNVGAGQGLLKVGSSLVPFVNKFPRNTELYKLMTTKFGEV